MGQHPRELDPLASPQSHFGAVLRSWRARRGLSLAQLGQLVHVSGDLLGKIEKAQRRALPDLVASLDMVLSANGDLLSAAERLDGHVGASRPTDAEVTRGRPLAQAGQRARSRSLAPADVWAAARNWGFAAAHSLRSMGESSSKVTPPVSSTNLPVQMVQERIQQLRHLDDVGGMDVLDWAINDLQWVQRMVDEHLRHSNDPREVSLNGCVAQLSQLGGWLACDAGAHEQAQTLWLVGLDAAVVAGDVRLGATIVSCLSYQALWQGHPRHALDLAVLACGAARGLPGGAFQALLATRQARARAQLGQERECRRCLDDAQSFMEGGTDEDPGWVYWVSSAVLAADAGRALLELGRPQAAIAGLTTGLRLFADAQPRNRALHLTSLAEAYLLDGEISAAATHVDAAVDLAASSPSHRLRQRLSSLGSRLERTSCVPARTAADRIRCLLAA